MFGAFKRRVGPAADARELEYISALHQTSSVLHTDATVSAEDVLLFLRSRFGLEISGDNAIDIVKGLSGTSRLPLPSVEKKIWKLWGKNKQEGKVVNSSKKKKKRGLRKMISGSRKQDEDEEDEYANVEAQWESLKGSDARKKWEFPALQRQVRREVPDNVTKLVRYDLVQMTAMLLIPSILRIERYRFKPPKTPLPHPEPVPWWEQHNFFIRTWKLASMAARIFTIPYYLLQRRHQSQLSAVKTSLRPKPDTLIMDVLRILLGSLEERKASRCCLRTFVVDESTTYAGSTALGRDNFPELEPTIVTKDLIVKMLDKFQQQAADDDDLVEQMVELVGGEGAVLDERAFATALTADVKRWPLECEDDVTTTFYDVYGFSNVECNNYAEQLSPEDLLQAPSKDDTWNYVPDTTLIAGDDTLELSFHSAKTELPDEEAGTEEVASSVTTRPEERPRRMGKIPKYKRTAPHIDYASDSFRSRTFVVYLFAFFLCVCVLTTTMINASGITELHCETSFGCTLVETIYKWFLFAAIFSLSGFLVIVPISMINHPYLQSKACAFFSIACLLMYMTLPLIDYFLVEVVGVDVSDAYMQARNTDINVYVMHGFYGFGCLTLIQSLRSLGAMLVPKHLIRQFGFFRLLFLPADIRRSAGTKRAGTYKINDILSNAYSLQRKAHKKTHDGNADNETMIAFLLFGEKQEDCGGFFWTWSRAIFTHSVRSIKDSVWVHARYAIGQIGQLAVTIVFVAAWWAGTKSLAASTDAYREELIEDGGVGTDTALFFVPESWMIYYSFIPGGSITISVLALLIMIPYPSTVSSVMKYRCGYLPSLHDPQFQKYRANSALIYYNTGNMIYAAIGAGGMFFILITGCLFLLFWPPTSDVMVLLAAWGIGLSITIGLKMILTYICGANYWRSMYRKKPLAANYSSLGYECWHLGLGAGVMISRLCQFLLASAFWIGRIDSKFLDDEVEMFGYRFDTVPEKYVAEILIHEAHHHPYIERLAAMYLMRLKHGEYFGSDAGAMWRQLFVLSLMPWLAKYSGRSDDDVDEDEVDIDRLEEIPPIPGQKMTDLQLSGNLPWNPSFNVGGSGYLSPEDDEAYDNKSDDAVELLDVGAEKSIESEGSQYAVKEEVVFSSSNGGAHAAAGRPWFVPEKSEYFSPEDETS